MSSSDRRYSIKLQGNIVKLGQEVQYIATGEHCHTRSEGKIVTGEMVKLGQEVLHIATVKHCKTRTEGTIARGKMVKLG